jgi:hypothetical protein
MNVLIGKTYCVTQEVEVKSEHPRGRRWLVWSSLIFAFLQSVCAFVVATSSIRVLIGLGSLAAAAGTDAPAKGFHFHQDTIRIPMMLFALVGSVVNLYALWRVRSLRKRPSSQWRIQPVTAKQKRSEWLQIALSVLTLVVLAAEWTAHQWLHHPH